MLAMTLALMAALMAGCVSTTPSERHEPTTSDVAEMGPGSLLVEVKGYRWQLFNNGKYVTVTGNVVNVSDAPIHGAMISAVLCDQNGVPFAAGEGYVRPTYLKPGANAGFEFVAMAKKARGVTATRLVYTIKPHMGF
jgi:hypothetical protein